MNLNMQETCSSELTLSLIKVMRIKCIFTKTSSYRRLHVTLLLKPLILKGDNKALFIDGTHTGSYVSIATAEGRRPI